MPFGVADGIIGVLVDRAEQNGGMALVLVVLLIGLATVLTISAQVSTALSLRLARDRQQRTALTIVAADSAWHCMPKLVEGGDRDFGTGEWQVVEGLVLPSRARSEVRVRKLPDSSSEAQMLSMAGYPRENCGLLVLESVASESGSGTVASVSCLLERDRKGRTEILGWLERR